MTQTVLGDDICPVRADREEEKKKDGRGRGGLLKARSKILCYSEMERGGRGDLWAESKVNNYNIVSHFFGARLKEDHLSRLIGNFLLSCKDGITCCLRRGGLLKEATHTQMKERRRNYRFKTWLGKLSQASVQIKRCL